MWLYASRKEMCSEIHLQRNLTEWLALNQQMIMHSCMEMMIIAYGQGFVYFREL
jgi:hypothetical protein